MIIFAGLSKVPQHWSEGLIFPVWQCESRRCSQTQRCSTDHQRSVVMITFLYTKMINTNRATSVCQYDTPLKLLLADHSMMSEWVLFEKKIYVTKNEENFLNSYWLPRDFVSGHESFIEQNEDDTSDFHVIHYDRTRSGDLWHTWTHIPCHYGVCCMMLYDAEWCWMMIAD